MNPPPSSGLGTGCVKYKRMKQINRGGVTSFIHQKKWEGSSVSYAQFKQGTNPIFKCKDLWERKGEESRRWSDIL